MSGGARLCRLIEEYLRPFICFDEEDEIIVLNKDEEKHLLIALSQVYRQIQQWMRDLDLDADKDSPEKSLCEEICLELRSNGHCCLTDIVANLITMLKIECQFVQHLAGNVLVTIADFLAAASEGECDTFINLLCVCLELAIANLSSSYAPSKVGAEASHCDVRSSHAVLSPRLNNTNFIAVAGIIRVLRNILKNIKQEYDDDQFFQSLLDSITSCILNLPWDSLGEIIVGRDDITPKKDLDAACIRNLKGKEPRTVFLCNLIQLLSSLVELYTVKEPEGGLVEQCPLHGIIIHLMPMLLSWCLDKKEDSVDVSISEYFRHKLLMLMSRLSFKANLDFPTLVSWLQLLHQFFHKQLSKPIAEHEWRLSRLNDCVEGSPFLSSVSNREVDGESSGHLQRQALFIFIRCSISMINVIGETEKKCTYANLSSCLTLGSSSELGSCGKEKGLSELHNWLQTQLPNSMYVDYRTYMECCNDFSASFLQLFIHEDDLLFRVLFELLNLPFTGERKSLKGNWACKDVKEDILLHLSNIFNPMQLFHIFLAELHYDHQVLLDYLISKDTGVSCAEYLLRCLRIICTSWHSFMESSINAESRSRSYSKKRKVFLDNPDVENELSSTYAINVLPLNMEEHTEDYNFGCKHDKDRGKRFEKAKNCLLGLRSSVENLHRKKLFPYNPEVLLKRKRFDSSFNYCLSSILKFDKISGALLYTRGVSVSTLCPSINNIVSDDFKKCTIENNSNRWDEAILSIE